MTSQTPAAPPDRTHFRAKATAGLNWSIITRGLVGGIVILAASACAVEEDALGSGRTAPVLEEQRVGRVPGARRDGSPQGDATRHPRLPQVLAPVVVTPLRHPLAEFDEQGLVELVRNSPEKLGSLSVGEPNQGRLFNGMPMPEGSFWKVMDRDNSWGTREVVDSVRRAIESVITEYPNSHPLYVGHISRKSGGWLRPHRSHQSGRDVDLGFYYSTGEAWYEKATAETLDRERTWSLLQALITQGNVEYIFLHRDVQNLLLEHVRARADDEAWLEQLFQQAAGNDEALIRHRWGHDTHFHVRFYSERARETSRRAFGLLRRFRKI